MNQREVEAGVLDALRKAMPGGVLDEWPPVEVEDALLERGLVSVDEVDGWLLVEPAGVDLLAASGFNGAGMTPHTIEEAPDWSPESPTIAKYYRED